MTRRGEQARGVLRIGFGGKGKNNLMQYQRGEERLQGVRGKGEGGRELGADSESKDVVRETANICVLHSLTGDRIMRSKTKLTNGK